MSSRQSDDTTPGPVASVAPLQDAHGQHSFVLQAIMEVQKAVGALGADIATLKGSVAEQGKKLTEIHGQVAFARGVMWVILGLMGVAGIVLVALFNGHLQVSIKP